MHTKEQVDSFLAEYFGKKDDETLEDAMNRWAMQPNGYLSFIEKTREPPAVVLDLPLKRPPREDYVRVTITFGRFTYEPAIEYRDGDNFDELAAILEGCALHASLEGNHWERKSRDAMDAAKIVGGFIARGWPDRAYFVEAWEEGKRGFAQVFQPFGVPRNR